MVCFPSIQSPSLFALFNVVSRLHFASPSLLFLLLRRYFIYDQYLLLLINHSFPTLIRHQCFPYIMITLSILFTTVFTTVCIPLIPLNNITIKTILLSLFTLLFHPTIDITLLFFDITQTFILSLVFSFQDRYLLITVIFLLISSYSPFLQPNLPSL